MGIQNRYTGIMLKPFAALVKLTRTNAKTKIGVLTLVFFIVISILEPSINNYRLGGERPEKIRPENTSLPPSWELPLGSDPFGRDMFGMMLMGIRYTLSIGLVAAAIEIVIAITLGFLSGYRGGVVDHIIRPVTDFIRVIPTWPILILIMTFTREIDLIGLSLVIAAFGWASPTRSLRSQVLSLRNRPYVELAKMSGLRDIEIIFKEILPNILPYVCAVFALGALSAMVAETGIRFLGIGPQGLPTLGYVIQRTYQLGYLTTRPYAMIPPILCLTINFVSLNLVYVGLDEEFNPRLKKITGL